MRDDEYPVGATRYHLGPIRALIEGEAGTIDAGTGTLAIPVRNPLGQGLTLSVAWQSPWLSSLFDNGEEFLTLGGLEAGHVLTARLVPETLAGLSGEQQGMILLRSSDARWLDIPIYVSASVSVTRRPVPVFSREELDFGTVRPGECPKVCVAVHNGGDEPLSVQIPECPDWLVPEEASFDVPPHAMIQASFSLKDDATAASRQLGGNVGFAFKAPVAHPPISLPARVKVECQPARLEWTPQSIRAVVGRDSWQRVSVLQFCNLGDEGQEVRLASTEPWLALDVLGGAATDGGDAEGRREARLGVRGGSTAHVALMVRGPLARSPGVRSAVIEVLSGSNAPLGEIEVSIQVGPDPQGALPEAHSAEERQRVPPSGCAPPSAVSAAAGSAVGCGLAPAQHSVHPGQQIEPSSGPGPEDRPRPLAFLMHLVLLCIGAYVLMSASTPPTPGKLGRVLIVPRPNECEGMVKDALVWCDGKCWGPIPQWVPRGASGTRITVCKPDVSETEVREWDLTVNDLGDVVDVPQPGPRSRRPVILADPTLPPRPVTGPKQSELLLTILLCLMINGAHAVIYRREFWSGLWGRALMLVVALGLAALGSWGMGYPPLGRPAFFGAYALKLCFLVGGATSWRPVLNAMVRSIADLMAGKTITEGRPHRMVESSFGDWWLSTRW